MNDEPGVVMGNGAPSTFCWLDNNECIVPSIGSVQGVKLSLWRQKGKVQEDLCYAYVYVELKARNVLKVLHKDLISVQGNREDYTLLVSSSLARNAIRVTLFHEKSRTKVSAQLIYVALHNSRWDKF